MPNTSLTSDGPDRDTLIGMYRTMTLIKLCDERFRAVIRAGRIAAPYYSPRGQEAISAALGAHLTQQDYLVTIYRGLHDHLAKGVPLKALWAEYAGRIDGSCKGKGGPMHITHPETGVVVTTGIVGSGIPIANGLAWASQLSGDGRVTVSSFGDGATNIGAFHEGLNLAAVWSLPVIFLCQNNGYAEHTKYEYGTSAARVVDRALGYGMASAEVDGNDPVAMWRVLGEAIARARTGNGPTLIEAKTFRFEGHTNGDTGEYIPKAEYEAALKRDPIPLYRAKLLREKIADDQTLAEIERVIGEEISAADAFAMASPYPTAQELRYDVLAEEIEP